MRQSLACKTEKRWSCYQHGFSCWNEKLEPKIGVTIGEGAPQDQDCKRLGKGRIVTKDLWINHPKNASIETHNGNNPKEPTTNVGVIYTTKYWNWFFWQWSNHRKIKCALGNWSTIIE